MKRKQPTFREIVALLYKKDEELHKTINKWAQQDAIEFKVFGTEIQKNNTVIYNNLQRLSDRIMTLERRQWWYRLMRLWNRIVHHD